MPDKTEPRSPRAACEAVVIWIDWYAYHVARFSGLQSAFGHEGQIVGLEMVSGTGVHTGLTFREDLPLGLPVETLMPGVSWRDADKWTLARRIWLRLTALDPTIVLVPGYYTLPAIAAALWARTHGRVSVLMTESTQQDHTRSAWKEKAKSLLIRKLFDWAVTGGAAHTRYLRALNFPADRIASFYDVVGNEKLREVTSCLRESSSASEHNLPDRYLLYVGRLAPEKNCCGLLESWTDYKRRGGVLPLVLAGDGPERETLHELAKASGFADEIYFKGHRSSRELWAYFAFASALVLPSTREPWGLVVNEAMAAALPVLVSSRCGSAESLVEHRVNGYLFDPHQPTELTDRLLEFDHLTPTEVEAMGSASLIRIAEFSPGNFGAQIAAIAHTAGVVRHSPAAQPIKISSPQRTRSEDAREARV